MRHLLWFGMVWFAGLHLSAQSFEVGTVQDVYKGRIGETVEIPLRLINRTSEPVSLVIKRVQSNLGSTQKDYFCPGNDCYKAPADGAVIRLDPGETDDSFRIAVDAGLASGISSVRYLVFNRYNPSESFEVELNLSVEEWSVVPDIFTHPGIVLHNVYPNPVVDHAFVKYNLLNPDLEARIVIHNILGNVIDEYLLSDTENLVKIRADALSAGIYFYTLYIDNEGVITRKLIVKK